MSKYYSKKINCVKCDNRFEASFLIGVSQPLNTKCPRCSKAKEEERIERVLNKHPDIWYRPDSDEYEIAVYKPNGDRRYYRHDIHAVQRIESWYGTDK